MMGFKKKTILTVAFALFISLYGTNSVFASKLPSDVWNYIHSYLPKAQQRFDSVVVVNENTMYIPLYPPSTTTVDKIQAQYVYPSNTTLSALPEVVLLNNGYSLLKVFKDKDGNYTLTKKDDLPLKVRLGLMPQDMLTPVGLKMPESLKLTLGDLLIPSKQDGTLTLDSDYKQKLNFYNPTVKRNEFISSAEFQNKKTFINPKNSKFIEVYDEKSKNPLYELKLSSMPLKIVSSSKSKVALVLYWNLKNLEIIDLNDERIIATIPIDATASDVTLDKSKNIAYVTSQSAKSIYVVNLNSMQLDKVIKLDQKPSKIAYCETDDTIAFFDEFTSKVYSLRYVDSQAIVIPQENVNNVSKILIDKNNIYAISRTDSELHIFDKAQNKLINTITLDKKPTDAILYNGKIFVLCSKEGFLDIYDINEQKIVSKEPLSKDGFYSNMTLIPNDKNILITGINSKNYLLFNIDKMKLTKVQESYIDVANIVIMDKNTATPNL